MIRNAHAENYEFVSFPEMRTSAITMYQNPQKYYQNPKISYQS